MFFDATQSAEKIRGGKPIRNSIVKTLKVLGGFYRGTGGLRGQ